jgi:hypothetical protein
MHVSATRIAEAILTAAGTVPDPNITNDLASCIVHGNGALRVGETRTVWLVLDSILKASDANISYPLLVRSGLRMVPRPKALLLTDRVANNFRDAARAGIGRADRDFPAGYRRTWAPCPTVSDDPVPMGGVTQGTAVANTIDILKAGNEFDWFNLESLTDFPVGCLVYRLKSTGPLAAYQRLTPTRWLNMSIPEPICPVDLSVILGELEVSSIGPGPENHPRPLLHSVAS